MKNRRTLLKGFAATVVVAAIIGNPALASASGARMFIKEIGKQAIDSLTSKTLSDRERESRFRSLLDKRFDVPVIARFTLGRYWRRASKDQKAEYVKLFEDFIVQAYAARFKKYSGEGFEVGSVREINDREQLVGSDIVLADGKRVPVHWRVRGNSEYRVVDVVVEGVSMAITQRDEFAAIINQNGGKIDGLISALRKKTGNQ